VLDTKIPRRADKHGVYEWSWAPEDPVSYTFYKEGFRAVQNRALLAGDEHIIELEK
jgi:hypothetical protein